MNNEDPNTNILDSRRGPISIAASKGNKGEPPRELFHYTTVNGLLGILESKSLRATHAQFSNDSEEMTHGIELIGEQVEELEKTLPEGKEKDRFHALMTHVPKVLQICLYFLP